MVGGWKRKMLKVLLFLHLFLLVGGVLLWGKGYVSLAHHRHQGVLYELTELLSSYHWHPLRSPTSWLFWHPRWTSPSRLFPLEADLLHVSVHDPEEPQLTGLSWHLRFIWQGTMEENLRTYRPPESVLFIWQGTLEENLRTLQPPEAVNSLVWVEGVERSGNKESTLIAWGKVDLIGLWIPIDKYGRELPRIHGVGEFSQRIYNLGRLWMVSYSFRDSLGMRLSPMFHIMHHATSPRVVFLCGIEGSPERRFHGEWGWQWEWKRGKALTSIDILERVHWHRPGVMPIGYRLSVLRAMPTESDIFYILPHPHSVMGPWDTPYSFALMGLGLVFTPYRYLFYLPLALVPRVLVWPVAVLWGMLLLGSWFWAVVVYRQWPKPER